MLLALAAVSHAGSTVPALAADASLEDLSQRITVLLDQQKIPQAKAAAEEFMARVRAESGEDSAEFAGALSRLGAVLHVEGRVSEADPIFNRSLELYRKHRPPGHPDIAAALNNVGMQHRWLGRFQEAPKLLEEALEIREKALPPDDPLIAESLSNLAFAYLSLGRGKEALPLCRRALSILEKMPDKNDRRLGTALQNLAGTLEIEGDFKGSQEALARASAIYAKTLPETHPLLSGVFSGLGVSFFLEGRFKQAETAFREARRRQASQPPNLTSAATATDFALNQMELKKLDEAKALLETALKQRSDLLPAGHPEIARTLATLGEAVWRQGHFEEALMHARNATAMTAARDRLDDRTRLALQRHVKAAWSVYEMGGRTARDIAAEALIAGQLAARGDTARTVSRMGARLAARDPALKSLVRALDDLDAREPGLELQLSHELALPPEARTAYYGNLKRELLEIAEKRIRLQAQIAKDFPDYARLVSPAPLPAAEIAAQLAPDETAIFILPCYDATYVWALTREELLWSRVAMPLRDAKSWVSNLRAGIDAVEGLKRGERPALFDLGFSHDLYMKLFSGIEPAISGKAHLLIVPSGPFDAIPFHFLLKEKPPVRLPNLNQIGIYKQAHWMIRDHAISILPSLAGLKTLRGAASVSQDAKAMIGFANPTFGAGGGTLAGSGQSRAAGSNSPSGEAVQAALAGGWAERKATFDALSRLPALADTEDEVRTVAGLLAPKPSDIVLAGAATETAVKSTDLSGYRTVYFATHGLKAEDVPGLAEPALALSIPANPTELDDGLLTASEITELKLDADLVVLSACNTAAPKTPGSEGLSGLAQAFLHAGARSLLVSHWAVPSEAAVKLTTATFKEMQQTPGLRRSEALRRAMLALIEDPSFAMNAYPAFWSPFVIVGD